MTDDNIDHIIIEHLRAIRCSLARHDQKFDDVLSRLNHLERNMTRLHGEYADTQEYTLDLVKYNFPKEAKCRPE